MLIYCITNKINGKQYVGQTVYPVSYRWKQHQQETARGCNFLFHKAVRKYGANNFSVEVLEELKQDSLDEREVYWINDLNTLAPNGYNTKLGRQGRLSEKSRRSISERLKGIKRSEETKRKMSLAKKGSIPWCTGKHLSQDTRNKMRASQKGRVVSDITKEKLRCANIGKTLSEETKDKISLSMSRKGMLKSTRLLGNIANTGRKRSPETIQKLKDAWVRRRLLFS